MSQPELPFEDAADQDADLPLIYVASAITAVQKDAERKRLINAEIQLVKQAIEDCTLNAEDRWQVRIHAPIQWSAPWLESDSSPTEIFNANSRFLLGQSDGLVVHGFLPSAGVGQEIEWAAAAAIPVLYLASDDQDVSRQVSGSPNVEVGAYRSTEDMAEVIRRWLRTNRRRLVTGPSTRLSREIKFFSFHASLAEAWTRAQQGRRLEVMAAAGLSEQRVEWFLSHTSFVATAPTHVVLSLATTLGVALPTSPLQPPTLTIAQTRALLAASDEYGWTDSITERVAARGRMELARSATRRFRLESIGDWLTVAKGLA